MMGRLKAAARRASTVQLSSGPKKTTAPAFHCSARLFRDTRVSAWVSFHTSLNRYPGTLFSSLIFLIAYVMAPEISRPCMFRTNVSALEVVRYPMVMFVTAEANGATKTQVNNTTPKQTVAKQHILGAPVWTRPTMHHADQPHWQAGWHTWNLAQVTTRDLWLYFRLRDECATTVSEQYPALIGGSARRRCMVTWLTARALRHERWPLALKQRKYSQSITLYSDGHPIRTHLWAQGLVSKGLRLACRRNGKGGYF